MIFARHTFELSEKQDDGSALIDHLTGVWERSGEMPKKLADAPELPPSSRQLWSDFLDLHGARGNNGMAISRITWRDLADWQRFRGRVLESWEADAIRAVDDLWLSEFAGKKEGEE